MFARNRSGMGTKWIGGALVGAALLTAAGGPARAGGTLDDWWLCVERCADEDATCVDACTEDYNASNAADPIRTLTLKKKAPSSGGLRAAVPKAASFAPRCPAGSTLSPFDLPIYDEQGLFVVDFGTVWVCIPSDLEPAG